MILYYSFVKQTKKKWFYRSLQPLVMSILDPDGAEILRKNREKLSHDITELINEYGPKVFTDFDGK